MKVPKPPRKIKIVEDKRQEYLEKWKKLFEGISPEIKVVLNNDKDDDRLFRNTWNEIVEGVQFEGFGSDEAMIIVLLPKRFDEEFLIGLHYDWGMFSQLEISADELYQEGNGHPCLPEKKLWVYWYKAICTRYNNVHAPVPEPPPAEDKNAGT